MSNHNYCTFILLLILISISYVQNNKTINRSEYDYEDDEQEEDRKKGVNETHIIILNDSNYTTEIPKYDSLFLIFYMSPCQDCKMYMPHFIRMSHYSYDFNLNIKFAKVDAKLNEKIVKEYNIQDFPQVLLFYKNKIYYYKSEITSAGLLKFYEKIKNGPIRELKSLRELEIVIKAHMKILLSTIKDKNLVLYKSLIEFSEENGKIELVSCISDDCIEKYGKDDIFPRKGR